jgi:putative serine protease PepD
LLAVVTLAVASVAVAGVTALTVGALAARQNAIPVVNGTGAARLGGSVQRVAVRVPASVVKLETTVAGGYSAEGSGIILSPDGLILTNDHVAELPAALRRRPNVVTTRITVSDGRTAPFTLVGGDPVSDIAVVRAKGLFGLTPIQIGSSADLVIGQGVVAVGAPLGMDGTVTTGIISALHRPISSMGETFDDVTVLDAIQTDAAINPGNSGGALVDMTGSLVGVNAASATTGGDYVNGPSGSIGIGFAIPVDQALRIAGQLVSTGRATHATLGAKLVEAASPRRGAKIVQVDPGGPAATAGLPEGALITKVDDRPVTTVSDLAAALQSKAPGDMVTATYVDPTGRVATTRVTLGSD